MGRNLETADVRGLLGLFLADGYLTYCHCPAKSYIKGTLSAGVHERAFLEEKVAEVQRFVPTQARITPYLTPRRESGKRTTVLRFRFSSGLLRPVYNLLYPYRERDVTRAALELLGGRAAAWLWAEGCRLGDDGATLKRVGSTTEEARLISGWLQVLTGAESTVLDQAVRPRLRFDREGTALVQAALLEYAPQSRRALFLPGQP